MSPTLATYLAVAAGGVLLSPLLARLATKRACAQPVSYDADAERGVLAALVADPQRSVEFREAGLRPEMLAHPARQSVWRLLDEHDGDVVAARHAAGGVYEVEAAFDEALASERSDFDDATLSRWGTAIFTAAEDRDLYPGAHPVTTRCAEPPMVRTQRTPTLSRYLVGAAFLAVCGAWAVWLAPGPLSLAALCGVFAYGYLSAVVDRDSLMVDLRIFWAGSAVLWLTTLACAMVGETTWGNVALGAGIVVAWGVLFEVANALYKRVRGVDGLGFGDTMIAVVCIGVPTALSGSLIVGFYSVFAAAVLALAVQLPLIVAGKRGRSDAFALGPYLAVGWAVAWSAVLLGVGGV